MKQEWSGKWNSSRQPRKQRKFVHNAPLHARHRLLSVHLTPDLRKRFGKRAVPVRKGDEIMVATGSLKGKKGKVERVSLKHTKVYVEEIKVKKGDGSEVMRALRPSNLIITSMNLDDKFRSRALGGGPKPKEKPKAEEVKK